MPANLKAPSGLKWPKGSPQIWDYLFYLDFEIPGHYTPDQKRRLWDNLSEFSLWQRSLGIFLMPSLRDLAPQGLRTALGVETTGRAELEEDARRATDACMRGREASLPAGGAELLHRLDQLAALLQPHLVPGKVAGLAAPEAEAAEERREGERLRSHGLSVPRRPATCHR